MPTALKVARFIRQLQFLSVDEPRRKIGAERLPMRNVIFAINMTIDGCCDHTKVTGSDEVVEYHTRLMRDVDLLVFGRKTYQLMVPFWPDVAKNHSGTKIANEFAQVFDSIEKVVFSQSLDSVEDKKTRVVRSNLQGEVRRLKQEQGGNILVGGVALPSQLMALGLIDEYHVVVHPVIVGEGRRLLEGSGQAETQGLAMTKV